MGNKIQKPYQNNFLLTPVFFFDFPLNDQIVSLVLWNQTMAAE